MSYLKSTWLRPAASLLVVLAITALWLMGAPATEAGNPGSVVVTPANAQVGAGGTTTVNVDITAPDGGLSVWVVEIEYNPAVVEVVTCNPVEVPGTTFQALSCDTKAVPPGGADNRAVAFGAWVQNSGGNATGWTGTRTVATFTFRAIGTAGQSSPLTVTVCGDCFLRPDTTQANPNETNGLITITAGVTRTFGDVDCSGGAIPVDIGDPINIQRDIANLPVNAPGGCPGIGDPVSVNGVQRAWGDVDCSGGASPVDIGDAINTQRDIANLPVNVPTGCPGIGDPVTVG